MKFKSCIGYYVLLCVITINNNVIAVGGKANGASMEPLIDVLFVDLSIDEHGDAATPRNNNVRRIVRVKRTKRQGQAQSVPQLTSEEREAAQKKEEDRCVVVTALRQLNHSFDNSAFFLSKYSQRAVSGVAKLSVLNSVVK